MNAYVDASVLLRVVLGEDGRLPSWPDIRPLSSDLIRVECLRVLERLKIIAALSDDILAERRAALLSTLGTFALMPLTAQILERAADPFPTTLGTIDAIHLATAIQLREEYTDLTFATHDEQLSTAARSVGFVVEGA